MKKASFKEYTTRFVANWTNNTRLLMVSHQVTCFTASSTFAHHIMGIFRGVKIVVFVVEKKTTNKSLTKVSIAASFNFLLA
jgi:hypothetical protein